MIVNITPSDMLMMKVKLLLDNPHNYNQKYLIFIIQNNKNLMLFKKTIYNKKTKT